MVRSVESGGTDRPFPEFANYEWTYRNDKFPHLTFYAEMRWSLNASITGAAIFTITPLIHQPVPLSCSSSSSTTPSRKLMMESESFL